MNTIFLLSYFVITVQLLNHNNYNIVSYLFLSFEIYDLFLHFSLIIIIIVYGILNLTNLN